MASKIDNATEKISDAPEAVGEAIKSSKRGRGRPRLELTEAEIEARKRHRLDYLNEFQKRKYRRHMDEYESLKVEVVELRREVERLHRRLLDGGSETAEGSE